MIIEHTLNGRIHVLDVDVLAILTENNPEPIRRRIDWLGHTTHGIKLNRTVDGRGLLSSGSAGDSIAWGLDNNGLIQQRAIVPFEQTCLSVTLIAGSSFHVSTEISGQYCLALYQNAIELYSSQSMRAKKLYSLAVDATGKFLCFFQLPRATNDGERRRFLAITDTNESFAWSVDFPKPLRSEESTQDWLKIELVCRGPFPSVDDIYLISAVDPMGWRATINSDSLDIYTREVLVTVSKCGRLQTWTTNLTRSTRTLTWLNLSTVPTNLSKPSLVHGTSERKVAMGFIP